MIRRTRPGPTAAVLTALALGVVAWSGPAGVAGASTPGGDSDATIVVALDAETNSWRPGSASFAAAGYNVAYSIYDPLVVRAADGSYQPYLAESVEPNEDFTVWTVTLRDGVMFHDDTPLDAEALVANFTDYLMAEDSEVAGDDQLGQVEELALIDELTVEYRLVAPNAVFPDILTTDAGFPFSPTAAAQDPNGENPVGTGPFVFDEWTRDSQLTVVRNENYWQEGQPSLAAITFRPMPDTDTREQALAAGDVDAMLSLTGSSTVGELDGVTVTRRPGNVAAAVLFNNTAPPFDDVRVRRALSTAIDPEELMIVSEADGTAKANQMFGVDSPYYSEDAAAIAEELSNDPEAAQAELQGYLDDPERSDGAEPGDSLSITLHCNSSPAAMAVAQFYQSEWNDIGVDVEIIPVESATLQAQARSKEYQAQCYRVGKEFDAGRALDAAFGQESSQNFTGYSSPEVTALLDELRSTSDPATRVDLVGQISVILAEAVPQLYGAPTVATWAAADELSGMDTWVLPDGAAGAYPVYLGTVMWGQVASD
ncbi:ABC transporter substrate-binding protein [Desertimonas flava]|uniref:ABC transporter substrate-binding protein n=1 Tax=Desertimonas flava TaxID=2064846 RepID=UPI0013C5216E|nr:ABC transporter substrate-binding protein [Desertimonas flava]